ncbi:ATP-grasp domain-containing protein [Bacillus sp. JCM 19034]|uniref:ATP-grasp domain-containing protein n=1 Tax=Bacillus sp. JCM 19034 TaxID=1481928 RepID=UPI0007836DBC|nr:ATP-grasp domain-containing protein [Bacillus sp. JCM 19034]
MKENTTTTLPHLDKSIPSTAEGYLLSGYSIALEGWRRGLNMSIKVIFDSISKTRIPIFTLSNDTNSYTFKYTRADSVSKEAILTCVNKELTKKALLDANVSVPFGETIENETPLREIIKEAKKIGYPVVVKPTNGTGGKGVIANIQNDQELKDALNYIQKDLKISSDLIIEKFQSGYDYRCYVVDDKVVASYKREPLHIIGNGKDSIKQLLEQKNKQRLTNPALKTRPLKVDKETDLLLARIGYDLNSIPKEGQKVYLKSKNNVTSGGEAIDMTDQLSDKMKKLAVDAVKAIPTLTHAGVDLIIDEKNDTGVVLEINSRPHITAHLYPARGKSRDVPSALIDYFFPETVGYDRQKRSNLYFDFDQVLQTTYLSGNIKEIKVNNIPGDIILKRYNLYISENKLSFAKWLQLQATRNHVSGHIKSINNYYSIVFAGTDSSIKKLVSLIEKKAKSYKGFKLEEKVRKTPVKQGFHIISSTKTVVSETPVPSNYNSDVNQLIEAIKQSNREEIRNPTNLEFETLKSQLQKVQIELEEYKAVFGELPNKDR